MAFRVNEQITSERVQIDKSFRGEPLYISPILFKAVKNRTLEKARHNPSKSDIFSLGLTILEAGLLKSIQEIYSHGDEIDADALEYLI